MSCSTQVGGATTLKLCTLYVYQHGRKNVLGSVTENLPVTECLKWKTEEIERHKEIVAIDCVSLMLSS